MSNASPPPAGWYPDPAAPTWSLRYWDGEQWTDKTTPRPPAPTGPGGSDGEGHAPVATGEARAAQALVDERNADERNAEHQYNRPRRPLFRGVAVVLAASLVGLLVYISIPSGPSRTPGDQWFSGGVPGWEDVSLHGWPQGGGTVLHAWAVPGPRFGPDHPFMAVVQAGSRPVAQRPDAYLASLLTEDRQADPYVRGELVKLDDGAPGLLWSAPARLQALPGARLVNLSLYALHGQDLYWVLFETTTSAFRAERGEVQRVMLAFRAVH